MGEYRSCRGTVGGLYLMMGSKILFRVGDGQAVEAHEQLREHGSMIPQIEERIWEQWAQIPVSLDSEEVRAGPPCDFGEVNQHVAPPEADSHLL
ncbi:hypothetical protein F2Q69_00022150 [Brassica cretica]|uniref:Uncharacterized protein n=1 Tax=Brassica cretica TaxID=69181 RepID=A0A8S9QL88_BRACR|nr:hypothetical protein F2Q69_00022150 [Brassica cretica]